MVESVVHLLTISGTGPQIQVTVNHIFTLMFIEDYLMASQPVKSLKLLWFGIYIFTPLQNMEFPGK